MSRCGTHFVDGQAGAARREPRSFPIDIEVTKARASDRALELASELLPNGREENGYWRTGSIADDPGQSLAVTLQGPDKGMWCDHAASGPEGGGNMIQLAAMVHFRGNIGEALRWLNSKLGLDDLDPERLAKVKAETVARIQQSDEAAAQLREDRRRNALGLFLRGRPIADTPVEAYLAGRGVPLRALGHVPRCLAWHPEVTNKEAGRKLPCMLAAVVDLDGRHISTHRTWLAPDGKGGWTKADLEEPKMALGSFAGGFIPLWKGECRKPMKDLDPGTDVWTSEGIEDGYSAVLAKPGIRAIAAVTLGNIGKLRLPDQMGRLMIIGQRDTNPITLAALEAAVARQQEAGRDVWLTPPPAGFKDINEALSAREG